MSHQGLDLSDRPLRWQGTLHLLVLELILVALFGWWANWPGLGWIVAAYLPIRWLSLAAHEYGHVIGAGLGDMKVRTVSIGTGPSTVIHSHDPELRLGLWPSSGFVLADLRTASDDRRSKLLHATGGPAANLLVLVGLLIWRPGPLGWVAMAVQMVMLLTTLTVAEVRIPGLGDKVPSD